MSAPEQPPSMPDWYENQKLQNPPIDNTRTNLHVVEAVPEQKYLDRYIAAVVASGQTVVSYAHRDNGRPITFRPRYPL